MEKFSREHRRFAKLEDGHDSVYLSIERPSTLAAFFAYCNGQSPNRRIFLRGSTENHPTAYPSLFRKGKLACDKAERLTRWMAYKQVLQRFSKLDGDRWNRTDVGAVLQHYGIKTPWLDVVRNLYTAVWFASYELRPDGLHGNVKPTSSKYCWIEFYRREIGSTQKKLRTRDLSAYHSSKHLRPHTQHGMSLAMQPDNDKQPHLFQDFGKYRIAQIRIPNDKKWKLFGHMSSSEFMFPPKRFDDSLKRLSGPVVEELLNSVCEEFNMPHRSLGQISSYH